MAAQRNTVQLGATLLVVFLLFFLILLWLPHTLLAGPTRTLRVRFPQAMPLPMLQEGSKVLVAGRPVGSVTALALEPMPQRLDDPASTQDLYLLVTAKIDARLSLKRDCRIRAIGEVLGGAGSLTIDVGAAVDEADLSAILEGAPPGGFGAYLESLGKELDGDDPHTLLGQIKSQLDPGRADSLMAKVHLSMDDLNAVTRQINAQLDPGRRHAMLAKLHETMDHLNAVTAVLREQMDVDRPDAAISKVGQALDALNHGLNNVVTVLDENRWPLHETMVSLASAAGKVDSRIVESIAEQVDARNAAGLVAKLHQSMDQLNLTLENFGVVSETTRQVIVLNRENLNRLLVNFKETSDHLKSAAKYILRHPWRLLNEPKEIEIKQQAIFDAARNFAEAATRLDDAAAQLRALADVHGGQIPEDDADLARIRAALRQSFEKFGQAEKALWRELNVR
jgi:ABC-type transporter Mla subunit MlaD